MNQHMPAMEKRVIPWMEERIKKELKPLKAHDTLASLVDQMAERHEHALAFGRLEEDGIARTTYLDVQKRADAIAARLAALGVKKGDRVVLSGHNHPNWPVAFFGIVRAGATAVPVDPAMEPAPFANVVRESDASIVLWDEKVEAACRAELRKALPEKKLSLHQLEAFTPPFGDSRSRARALVGAPRDRRRRRREPHLHERHHGQAEGRSPHAFELHLARRRARAAFPAQRAAIACSASCRCTTRSSSRAA